MDSRSRTPEFDEMEEMDVEGLLLDEPTELAFQEAPPLDLAAAVERFNQRPGSAGDRIPAPVPMPTPNWNSAAAALRHIIMNPTNFPANNDGNQPDESAQDGMESRGRSRSRSRSKTPTAQNQRSKFTDSIDNCREKTPLLLRSPTKGHESSYRCK